MKILTIERDCGTSMIGYQFGQVEGDNPNVEGYELIECGSLNIDTDEFGNPEDPEDDQKLKRMRDEAGAVFEVDNIAAHTNCSRVK